MPEKLIEAQHAGAIVILSEAKDLSRAHRR